MKMQAFFNKQSSTATLFTIKFIFIKDQSLQSFLTSLTIEKVIFLIEILC